MKLNDYTQVSSHLEVKVAYHLIKDMLAVSESTAKTPVLINVGRTWLIILHHISRVKPIIKAHLGSMVQ